MLPSCIIGVGCAVCAGVSSFPASTAYNGLLYCAQYPTSDFVIELKENSTLQDLDNTHARIKITGSNVWVTNVTVQNPIRVISEFATNISFTGVACNDCPAAVIVEGSSTARHGAVPVDITLADIDSNRYAAALAHTSGQVQCKDSAYKVLLQPVGSEKTVAPACDVTDLGELLSVFGEPYLLRFFDGKAHSTSTLITAVKIMTLVTVLMLVVTYLSAYHVWRERKQKQE